MKNIKTSILTLPLLIASVSVFASEEQVGHFNSVSVSYEKSSVDHLKMNGVAMKILSQINYTIQGYDLNKWFVSSDMNVFSEGVNDEVMLRNNYAFAIGYHDEISKNIIGYATIGKSYSNLGLSTDIDQSSNNIKIKYNEDTVFTRLGTKLNFNQNLEIDTSISINKQDNDFFANSETTIYYKFNDSFSIGVSGSFDIKHDVNEKKYGILFRITH